MRTRTIVATFGVALLLALLPCVQAWRGDLLMEQLEVDSEDYTNHPSYVHPHVVGNIVEEQKLWGRWMEEHQKTYGNEAEEWYRFSVFQQTLARVVRKNAELAMQGEGPNFGMNKFADLTPEEWAKMYLSRRPSDRLPISPSSVRQPSSSLSDIVADWDWRKQGVVTYIQDQGQCGSCWAFSVAETVEQAYNIKTNSTKYVLSPQQIVDCDNKDGNMGCNGGDPPLAYKYVMQNGLMTMDDYHYSSGATGEAGLCQYDASKVVAKIQNFSYATPPCEGDVNPCDKQDDVTLAQNVYEHGPTGIIVDAINWQDYTFGVFSMCSKAIERMDHAVQLVGWFANGAESAAAEGKVGAWIVRNSWGAGWGVRGYIYLKGSAYESNTCGLANQAIYADI